MTGSEKALSCLQYVVVLHIFVTKTEDIPEVVSFLKELTCVKLLSIRV